MSPPASVRLARPTRAALAACALVLLHPTPALAHGSLAVGDFYSGMLHPLLHLDTLLPVLVLALWSGQLGALHAWRLPLVFLGAALVGAAAGILGMDLYIGPPLLRFSMLVLGLLVAAQGKLPSAVATALAFVFGLYQGQTNTFEPGATIERPLLFVAGLGSSIGLILFHVVTRVVRYRAFWVQIAVRVLGSWIAATGLLVVALDWAGDQ